jgi:hypothetical protein
VATGNSEAMRGLDALFQSNHKQLFRYEADVSDETDRKIADSILDNA